MIEYPKHFPISSTELQKIFNKSESYVRIMIRQKCFPFEVKKVGHSYIFDKKTFDQFVDWYENKRIPKTTT